MAYVGKAPADTALTSNDLVDGIVSTNKLANDSVTSPKIVNATVANTDLANSAVTINGVSVSLGGSISLGPTISSISPTVIDNTSSTITITGAGFVSVPQVEFLNPSTGIW